MGMENLEEKRTVTAKIRYHHPGASCTIQKWENGTILCTFLEPQRAITPGQSVVFYEDNAVLGSFPDMADDSDTNYNDEIHIHSEVLEE